MAASISRALLDRILHHAGGDPAREVCGLLMGHNDAVMDAVPAANVAADPARRFEIDPATLFAAIRAERAGGPAIIGHYHSHPNGSAIPSPRDAADAAGPPLLWLIVAGGHAALWRSGMADGLHGCFIRVELTVTHGSMVA